METNVKSSSLVSSCKDIQKVCSVRKWNSMRHDIELDKIEQVKIFFLSVQILEKTSLPVIISLACIKNVEYHNSTLYFSY